MEYDSLINKNNRVIRTMRRHSSGTQEHEARKLEVLIALLLHIPSVDNLCTYSLSDTLKVFAFIKFLYTAFLFAHLVFNTLRKEQVLLIHCPIKSKSVTTPCIYSISILVLKINSSTDIHSQHRTYDTKGKVPFL